MNSIFLLKKIVKLHMDLNVSADILKTNCDTFATNRQPPLILF